MALIRSFAGNTPIGAAEVFLAQNDSQIGDDENAPRSSVWYGVVLRGDVYHIRIGAETSIQDNSVVHVTGGHHATIVGDRVTVGHSVVLHGCTVEDECIIGMGAVVMDRAVIGRGSIVGAGALVTPGTIVEPGQLVLGSPARAKRALGAEELTFIQVSASHYVDLGRRYLAGE
jgi:carbonic anhydrase/acetyltransferase-like protein (isoleucine patch superfamily)